MVRRNNVWRATFRFAHLKLVFGSFSTLSVDFAFAFLVLVAHSFRPIFELLLFPSLFLCFLLPKPPTEACVVWAADFFLS